MAGLAVYKSEILLDDDGNAIKRQDGGIIDEVTWHALCAKLHTTVGLRNKSTKGLLSKKLRCGACGAGMVRMQKRRKGRPVWFAYNCRSVDSGGCARISISGPRLDQQITDLVLDYLNEPVEVEDRPFAGQARLDELGGKIAELMTAYRSGELSGSIAFPSIKQLEDEQRLLQREAGKYIRSQNKITTAAAEWPSLGFDRQQAIIDAIFETIVILPAENGKSGKYNPARVQPVYRKLSRGELSKILSAMLSAPRQSLTLAA
jgi:hypothetical protein